MNQHSGLRPRELQAVMHASRGLKNAEIAKEMGISEHTAKDYVKTALRIVGVKSRVELAVWAVKEGLV